MAPEISRRSPSVDASLSAVATFPVVGRTRGEHCLKGVCIILRAIRYVDAFVYFIIPISWSLDSGYVRIRLSLFFRGFFKSVVG